MVSLLLLLGLNNPAINKASEAAYIQTGAAANVNKLTSYTEGKVKYYANEVGIENELTLALIGYKCYNSKKIQYRNLSISTNSVEVRIPF